MLKMRNKNNATLQEVSPQPSSLTRVPWSPGVLVEEWNGSVGSAQGKRDPRPVGRLAVGEYEALSQDWLARHTHIPRRYSGHRTYSGAPYSTPKINDSRRDAPCSQQFHTVWYSRYGTAVWYVWYKVLRHVRVDLGLQRSALHGRPP